MASLFVGPSSRASTAWLLCVGGLYVGCASASPITSADGPDLAASVDALGLRDGDTPSPAQDLANAPDLAMPVDLGPFPPGAVFQISVKATGQLLSVHNSATANGSIVEEQPARGTPDQRWLMQAVASGAYEILNAQSQTCLDVNAGSTADGATVWIWSCSGGVSQQWSLQDAGAGFYYLVNVNSQSCLDLDNSGTAPGTVIFQYHCKGGDNQKWFFTRVQ
jgi:cytochrome c